VGPCCQYSLPPPTERTELARVDRVRRMATLPLQIPEVVETNSCSRAPQDKWAGLSFLSPYPQLASITAPRDCGDLGSGVAVATRITVAVAATANSTKSVA
jgi:hypothetical protein